MTSIRNIVVRYRPGLVIVTPGIFNGVLLGSLFALFLPSITSFSTLFFSKLACYQKEHLASNPWFQSLVRPHHFLGLVLVMAISIAFIRRTSLIAFLRRCGSAIAYDPSLLWATCTFFVWVETRWSRRLLFLVFGMVITAAIVALRTRFSASSDPMVKMDRPITVFSEDKLERKPLTLSLVRRLISDGAPVIALIGAYGDGKTSILNLLEQELKNRKTVVVRFKSSLPGDDLTLVSTLFNSISKQLRSRFSTPPLADVFRSGWAAQPIRSHKTDC